MLCIGTAMWHLISSQENHVCFLRRTPIQVAEREGQWAAAAMLRAAVRVH